MDENIIQKRKEKFTKNIKNLDLIDARISSSMLRRKTNTDEHFMKNRAKVFYVSCLEVKEEKLDQISSEFKQEFQYSTVVNYSLKQSEQIETCEKLIKSNISQNVLFAVHKARLLTCSMSEKISTFLTEQFFSVLYDLIRTKNNLQILYECTWTLINIVFHYPKPEFLDLLTSNEIILNFYEVQLERYKLGGIDDLINNIILLIGNIMYRRNDKITLMRDRNILMKIAKCEVEDGGDILSHHSIWTLSEVLYNKDVNLNTDLLGMCADIFINYILNFKDKKVLTNAFKGLIYLIQREEYTEKAITKIIKNYIVNKIYSYDFIFMNEAISSGVLLLSSLLETNYSVVEYLIDSNIIEFLVKVNSENEFKSLTDTILFSLALITKSDNPKLIFLFTSGYVNHLVSNLLYLEDEKLEKAVIILTNLSQREEMVKYLGQISINLINFLEIPNKKFEIYLICLEALYKFLHSPFSKGLVYYLNSIGCKDKLESFIMNIQNQLLVNKAIMIKDLMTDQTNLDIGNYTN